MPKEVGMVISLPGVLLRAANVCKRSRDLKHLEFMLTELNKHLEILRDKPELHAEFFELYVKD